MGYKIMEDEESRCLECGEKLYGRPDKKFCNDICRNLYHNRQRGISARARNLVITHLMVNHRALCAVIGSGRTSASLDELALMGFCPSFITGHRRGRHRHEEYSCFDIFYYQSSSKIFNIRFSDQESY